jgi:hypothetical protein
MSFATVISVTKRQSKLSKLGIPEGKYSRHFNPSSRRQMAYSTDVQVNKMPEKN